MPLSFTKWQGKRGAMALFAFSLDYTEPERLFAALCRLPYSLFFDSASPGHDAARYSYVAFMPEETIEATRGRVTITNRDGQRETEDNPFDVLDERIAFHAPAHQETRRDLPPFQGGAAGMFGYDLGRSLERLPAAAAENPGMPDMAVGIYRHVVSFEPETRTARYIVHAADRAEADVMRARLEKLLDDNPPGVPAQEAGAAQWRSNIPAAAYKQKVRTVLDYIRAGDIFQANLSQRFTAALPDGFDPYAHYCVFRKVNPAPFASYMNFGAVKISSASPERFLRVRDRGVETRPIKGTRPRADSPDTDRLFLNQLENSEKDRAENAMIVDLLRNDLSKVCEDHSIDVPKLCELESFASVHHLVSTVTGSLRVDKSPAELLKACFPGGSITGCPKIRAMEIIEELEPDRRGPYCGALGYIGFDGTMDTSIAIRTLVYSGGIVSFQVGGGIVADSDPEKEYAETFDKAEAIFQSFDDGEGTNAAEDGPGPEARRCAG